jgi:hypothetical protein
MGLITENKLIMLNTRYATRMNGTFLSDLQFPFKGILTDEEDIVSSNICVMNCQIPISYYIINESNNQFLYDSNWITIPFGNYNANSLITILKTLMNGVIPLSVSDIVLTSSTGKLTFTFATSRTLNFPTTFSTGLSGNFSYLIFGSTAGSLFTGTSITLPFPLNLLGVNRLAIRSSKLLISSFNSFDMGLGLNLATIPVDQPPWGIINYSNQTDLNKSILMIKTIDMIDIQICDENNNLLNFNNTDYTITLVLEIIKKIPDRFIPSFRDLTLKAEVPIPQKKINKELEDLELLA